jgi:DNA-binding response OmpR family regulator
VDKILSLGFGADDYITKPFSMGELTARVKAHLRRSLRQIKTNSQPNDNTLICGELELDVKAYTLKKAGEPILLSAREFELLTFLVRNVRHVFTREALYEKIWDINGFGDLNTVSVHIRKLREKIETDPADPAYIKTVWGVGYKLETP